MKNLITLLAVAGLVLAFAPTAQAAISATGNFDLIRTHPWATFDDPNPGDWKLTYFDGSLGAGTLNVAGGSLFDANGKPVSVGWGAGTSTITVTGPGSELRNSNGFKAGVNTSHGDLIVEAGGLVDVQGQLMIGATGLGTALVTGVNSKLITATLLQFGQQTSGIGSILTVEDSGLVQTPAIKFGFDPSGGYLHMGAGGVLAVLGDKTGLTQAQQFSHGGLFTIQGAGSFGEIRYNPSGDDVTWVNMTGATEGTDYDLTYHSSSFIVNGQELNGYTVLTMPYAVTYDGNTATGGDAPTAQSKWYGVALTLASDIGTLEKTGYTFTGWNTAADGTGAAYALGASYTADAAVTLFAKWVTAVDDPFDNWLANLPAGQQSYDSDPDNDGIANLLEYAFGGDPTKTDQAIVMPTLDTSGGFLKLTFCHLKASLDPNLKYMPEISSSLKVAWSTDGLTTMGAPEGVLQDNLPDGKPFATSDYTRVTVTADKSMVEAVTKQFLRISVIRE